MDLGSVFCGAEGVPERRCEEDHFDTSQDRWNPVQDVVIAEALRDLNDVFLKQQAEDPCLREAEEHNTFEAKQFRQASTDFHEILEPTAELQNREHTKSNRHRLQYLHPEMRVLG